MTRTEFQLIDFEKSILNLENALIEPPTDITRDAAIKRFELVFELSWKLLKSVLKTSFQIEAKSPRSCFKEAFNQGLIEYDQFWLDITSLRNYTTHIYSDKLAESIYQQLPNALKHYQTLLKNLKKELSS